MNNYDLTVETSMFGIENTVDMIIDAKKNQSTPHMLKNNYITLFFNVTRLPGFVIPIR